MAVLTDTLLLMIHVLNVRPGVLLVRTRKPVLNAKVVAGEHIVSMTAL